MTDQAREWLESLYASAGPHADLAREVLDRLSDGEEEAEAREDELRGVSDRLEALEAFIEQQDDADFVGNTALERLKNGLRGMEARNLQYWDIRELCMAAGILARGDGKTDVIPLLRMFLPG